MTDTQTTQHGTIMHGDCLEKMKDIPDGSVDLILCDLPYGTTDCAWDSVIPFEPLWEQYKRIIRDDGTIVLFGNQPFTTSLIASNTKDFSHVLYWHKNKKTGANFAKVQPMRCIEDICVFVVRPNHNNEGYHIALRNWFMAELEKSGKKPKDIDKATSSRMASHYFTGGQQFIIPTAEKYKQIQAACPGYFLRPFEDVKREYEKELGKHPKATQSTYNPQGLVKLDAPIINKVNRTTRIYDASAGRNPSVQTHTGYPSNLLEFRSETNVVHPTQKPVALLEYLIKTYSNPGDIVVDNCMGSGSTCVACVNTDRRFIGIELDPTYYSIAATRIADAEKTAAEKKAENESESA